MTVGMHLYPHAPQRVFDKTAYDPSRCEDLRGSGNVLGTNFFFLPIESVKDLFLLLFDEELIHPANSFFIARLPGFLELWVIEQLGQSAQCPWTRAEPTGQVVGLKQHAHFLSQVIGNLLEVVRRKV